MPHMPKSTIKCHFPMIFSWLNYLFSSISGKFPEFFLIGKCLPIFQVFPVGTMQYIKKYFEELTFLHSETSYKCQCNLIQIHTAVAVERYTLLSECQQNGMINIFHFFSIHKYQNLIKTIVYKLDTLAERLLVNWSRMIRTSVLWGIDIFFQKERNWHGSLFYSVQCTGTSSILLNLYCLSSVS